jgi:hypothetical protein
MRSRRIFYTHSGLISGLVCGVVVFIRLWRGVCLVVVGAFWVLFCWLMILWLVPIIVLVIPTMLVMLAVLARVLRMLVVLLTVLLVLAVRLVVTVSIGSIVAMVGSLMAIVLFGAVVMIVPDVWTQEQQSTIAGHLKVTKTL